MINRCLLCVACALLAACASVRPAQRVAVDYNRAFAASRDEVLLLNILRAAGREPLQFSTMGAVTGSSTRGQANLSLPFTNVIAEGANSLFNLSPTLDLSESNPTLSILPQSDAEFTRGILSPIAPQTLGFFLNQGRDAEFLLPLVVGGVRCPGGSVVLNRGDYRTDRDSGVWFRKFGEMFAAAARGNALILEERRRDGASRSLRLASKDVLPLLQNGPGAGRRISAITVERQHPEHTIVTIQDTESEWVIRRADGEPPFNFSEVCGTPTHALPVLPSQDRGVVLLDTGTDVQQSNEVRNLALTNGVLLLRSVESVIYYLGETQRVWIDYQLQLCARRQVDPPADPVHPFYLANVSEGTEERVLFRVRLGCTEDSVPLHSAISTSFNGRRFFVPILEGPDDDDRTLKTLSFLSELIALQTSQALIQSSSPTIAIQRQ